MSNMNKFNPAIVVQVALGILLGAVLMALMLKSAKSEAQRRQELKQKGYNQHQIDSTIKKQDSDLTAAYINLAG